MKIGPFIQHVAQATGVAEATVKITARFLREAGYLTTTPTKARGVNGPEMVPRDAARLLLALLVTTSPAKAVASYEMVASMVASIGNTEDAAAHITEAGFPCAHGETVEEALTALMTPTTKVNSNLSLTVVSVSGCGRRVRVETSSVKEEIALDFRPDTRPYRAVLEAYRERIADRDPELLDAWQKAAKAEEAKVEAGDRPWSRPAGIVDHREISAATLLWLRWKVFEEG